MEERIIAVFTLLELLLLSAIFLIYPKIARRGLLFGAYVGEEASKGDEARAITGTWYRGMIAAILVCVAAGTALVVAWPQPFVPMIPIFAMIGAFFGLYYRAYRRALELAPRTPPPLAEASLAAAPPSQTAFPLAVLAACLVLAFFSLAYTLAHYDDLPGRVPIHFGADGKPDGWATKSAGSIMTMPILNVIMAVMLGGSTFLTARAKRAIRHDDGGASLEAQTRFRTAMTRFMGGIAILTLSMMTWLSIGAIRVGLGRAEGLGPWGLPVAGALVIYAIGGAIYMAVRYGQGGSRMEAPAAGAPLTDGLADNRFWKMGLFYVNRDDPSFMVENRFGLGYTINFGNWKAVAFLVGTTVALLAVAAWAIVAAS